VLDGVATEFSSTNNEVHFASPFLCDGRLGVLFLSVFGGKWVLGVELDSVVLRVMLKKRVAVTGFG
jgi:hypothetical protein